MSRIIVNKIHLANFRKIKSFLLEIEKETCLILAPNASGKTSILEAIQLLATGESFRADKTEEMVRFGEEMGRVAGMILTENDQDLDRLEIIVTRGIVQGKKTQSKLFSLNQARRRKKDFLGQFGSVAFRPEDMRLIEGSPSRRRSFMNGPLSLTFAEYTNSLKNYDQTLVRRNKLLTQIKDGWQKPEVLTYWNQNLIKNGMEIQRLRKEFIYFCNQLSLGLPFEIEYQQSLISEERLNQYSIPETAVGHTLVGPHKDDFKVMFKDLSQNSEQVKIDIETYGSRGQQRLAVLWLKLCELKFLEEKMGKKPVLLLDDILSELDDDSKELVLSLINDHQTIITTTEERVIDIIENQKNDLQIIRL